jgi:hypothetical protein
MHALVSPEQTLAEGSISASALHVDYLMSRLRLPQREELKAFGGRPCFAPLMDVHNNGVEALRAEWRVGEMEAWLPLVPNVAPGSSWASTRNTPLWVPRVATVRLVSNLDGRELLLRSPWGDGGILEVSTAASPPSGT